MKNRMAYLIYIVLISAVLAACGSSAAGTSTPAASSGVSLTQEATQTGVAVVKMINFSYSPAELTIPAGTTVQWTNEDSVQHTVTADDGSFDSKQMNFGDVFSYTFKTPGTYTYKCTDHIAMIAKIIVTK
jgi:plastocyanin